MSSKLRPLYDRLYIRVDTFLQARAEARANRKYARTVTPLPTLDEDYKTIVRPYWKQFRVAVPKKYSFRLFCNADKGPAPHVDPRYIPDELWYDRIVPHYNNLLLARALQDKCLLNVIFPDIRRPVTVVKCISGVFYDDGLNLLTREQAIARFPGHGRVIVKISLGSSQGRDISFYDSDSLTPAEIEEIFRRYGDDFIVQEKMAQHPVLEALNPSSLNTVRVITFFHEGEVRILTAILRVGGSDSEVDNTSRGGYKATVRLDGRLHPLGLSTSGGDWRYAEAYPNGIRFEDVVIPSYDRIKEIVTSHAARMSHFKLIGWDIAVAPDGEPVLVEYNVIPAPGHSTDGPLFGDLTDTVLEEVFGRRTRR